MKIITHLFAFSLLTISILSGCSVQPDTTLKVIQSGNREEGSEARWKEIQTGLSYTDLHLKTGDEETDFKDILLVKIDPKRYVFSIYQNPDQEKAKTIEEIHAEQNALISFNGQFFTEDFKPTGLLISEGEEIRNYSTADLLNGILAIDIKGNVQFFERPRGLNEKNFTFAIQNGPVLIGSNGDPKITEDSGKTASRTAIGLDKDGNLILIVLKQSFLNFDNSITLYEFAQLLKNHPQLSEFGLHSVLNLDGGTSTGLMIDNKYYPEMEKVQNVVLVKER